ncbi:hypothetical protein EBR43_03370 [bacterium]|nr:hypothetical protein [bacterium]
MKEQTKEILTILQEEAAEVIVEISKCLRFGIDDDKISRLNKEIGDLCLMVDLLINENIGVDAGLIDQAKQDKIKKLKIYSNIDVDQND